MTKDPPFSQMIGEAEIMKLPTIGTISIKTSVSLVLVYSRFIV